MRNAGDESTTSKLCVCIRTQTEINVNLAGMYDTCTEHFMMNYDASEITMFSYRIVRLRIDDSVYGREIVSLLS